MIVYEVGSIIAVKESNGSRILHGFNAIGINGHPSSRSATRLRKKLRRRANKCAKRWLGQRRSYLTRPRATPLRWAPRELKKRGAPHSPLALLRRSGLLWRLDAGGIKSKSKQPETSSEKSRTRDPYAAAITPRLMHSRKNTWFAPHCWGPPALDFKTEKERRHDREGIPFQRVGNRRNE
jgi:hypothetical protein